MLKAIYLSGWEYNRVLQLSPLEPVASGLPAQVLWSGSAQFWLFETVYCTKEALDGDVAAYNALGWTSGRIFSDLARRGFLTPVDWTTYLNEAHDSELTNEFIDKHRVLREYYDRAEIRKYLEQGNEAELEAIKLYLLSPLLKSLHCVKNISPNSIRHWISPRHKTSSMPPAAVTAGTLLEQAIATGGSGHLRAMFHLCNPPGTGLPQSIVAEQARIEQQIQRPLIPALLEGSLSQDDYHAQLLSTRHYYEDINQQLWNDYRASIEKLERLREIASSHLWPNLHGDWLPLLESDPTYLRKFRTSLRDALLRKRFDPYLQYGTDLAINAVSLATGTALGLAAPNLLTGAAAMGMIAYGMRRGLEILQGQARKESDSLTLFLQKSSRALARQQD